jgi:beta-N-acetylhexosaminidase
MDASLKEKIGQLMVFGFEGKVVNDQIKEMIHDYKIGSIILFKRNIGTALDVLQLNTHLQKEAKAAGQEYPLLICADQENGVVRRLREGTTLFPGAMSLGATQDSNLAYEVALASGVELKGLGINWNLAPVVDVNNNPQNPVIGIRSFGENPEKVSEFGIAAVKGMQEAGVITTLKHFPGHGDTNVDSHLDLPVISHDRKRLKEVELKPFIDGISNGADMIMTAHIYFPAFEKEEGTPATISKSVITGLLREELGFTGVVTTDCLEMNAISKTIGTPRGAVEALKAGVDIIMISHSYELQKQSLEAIYQAVQSGEVEISLIEAAYERVVSLKKRYVNWNELVLHADEVKVPEPVGGKAHAQLAEDAYRKGITLVKNEGNLLPFSKEDQILVLYPENSAFMQVEDRGGNSTINLGTVVQEYCSHANSIQYSATMNEEELTGLMEKAGEYESIIVGTMTVTKNSPQVALIEGLLAANKRLAVVSLRSPYDISYFPRVPVYVAAFEFSYPALEMAVKALLGLEKVEGILPVTIPNLN